MNNSDLVFIGIKGTVVALNRATGEQLWAKHLTPSTIESFLPYVVVVLQNEAVLASYNGEVFSLDPLTGDVRWHNPLKGLGTGLASIATMEPNPSVAMASAAASVAAGAAAGAAAA